MRVRAVSRGLERAAFGSWWHLKAQRAGCVSPPAGPARAASQPVCATRLRGPAALPLLLLLRLPSCAREVLASPSRLPAAAAFLPGDRPPPAPACAFFA
jgi:hypothetical protein